MQKMPSMPNGRSRSAAAKLRRNEPGAGAGMLCVILVMVSLVVFTLSVREAGNGFFSSVRDVTQTVVSPLRMLGAGITAPFSGFGNVVRNLTAEEQTLSELKAENERLSARNVELEEAEITAKRLQELLNLRSSYNLQSVAARVISGSTDSWTATVTIDQGKTAGLAVGMPVVDEYGAVGQLISCAGTTATVRLLADEGSSISAMVQSSRAQGMLEGSPNGTLRLSYIRTDQTINVGDIVVTSGLGGVFPKGLPLGKVASVDSSPGASYYEIVVEPFTKPGSLEEVLVVTSLTEEQQAGAEDIERADAADLESDTGTSVPSDAGGDEGEEGAASAGDGGDGAASSEDGQASWDAGALDTDSYDGYDWDYANGAAYGVGEGV